MSNSNAFRMSEEDKEKLWAGWHEGLSNHKIAKFLFLEKFGGIEPVAKTIRGSKTMRKEYDLSKMKSRRNPYSAKLKRQVTIRMGDDVIEYFKAMAEETGIPYQTLINLYLRDCVANERELDMSWHSRGAA